MSDTELLDLASELVSLGLAKAEDVEDGVVIRQAKAQCTTTSTVSILR